MASDQSCRYFPVTRKVSLKRDIERGRSKTLGTEGTGKPEYLHFRSDDDWGSKVP